MLWWSKAGSAPPLVTTAPDSAPSSTAGRLDQPSTSTIFGGNAMLDDEGRSGGRLELGWWMDEQHEYALVGSFFILGDASTSTTYSSESGGSPILARPYTDWTSGNPAASLVSYPNLASGSISVNSSVGIWGGELYLRRLLIGSEAEPGLKIDWLAGGRLLSMREGLNIDTSSLALTSTATVTTGTLTRTADNFATENYGYFGEVGVGGEWQWAGLELGVIGKLGFGVTHQVVDISGSTRQDIPGNSLPTAFQGGLLAQPTNINRYAGSSFSLAPEIGVQVAWPVTPTFRVIAGYTFLYWTNVVRPGDQMDTVINTTGTNLGTLTGDARPAFLGFRNSDMWLQGINLGIEWRY
jgi:hypothetical protein